MSNDQCFKCGWTVTDGVQPFLGPMQNHNQKKMHIHRGQLILRKISKTGATICQILRIKCTKFDFRCGSAPDPTAGAYNAPLDR